MPPLSRPWHAPGMYPILLEQLNFRGFKEIFYSPLALHFVTIHKIFNVYLTRNCGNFPEFESNSRGKSIIPLCSLIICTNYIFSVVWRILFSYSKNLTDRAPWTETGIVQRTWSLIVIISAFLRLASLLSFKVAFFSDNAFPVYSVRKFSNKNIHTRNIYRNSPEISDIFICQ